MAGPYILEDVRAEGHRVIARVNGVDLWFECKSHRLRPAAEAFAGMMFPAAPVPTIYVQSEVPLCETFLANNRRLARIYEEWWKRPIRPIEADPRSDDNKPKPGRMICFTGGVDSFHELLTNRPDALVYFHGYDIPLAAEARMADWERRLHTIADHFGVEPIVIRTNVKKLAPVNRASWDWVHGAAIAAAAHLLSDHIGTLTIPSSYTYDEFTPWGTSWVTDRLFSSARARVEHGDAAVWRIDKLYAMQDDPLVQDNLRVCLNQDWGVGNCSRCEKCVRTMVTLSVHDRLKDFSVFDLDEPLPRRILKAPFLGAELHFIWNRLAQDSAPEVRWAIRQFLLWSVFRRNVRAARKKLHARLGPRA